MSRRGFRGPKRKIFKRVFFINSSTVTTTEIAVSLHTVEADITLVRIVGNVTYIRETSSAATG